jgi:coiled-coil-helix-coiled-coil-helix domain-containing protein 2
LLSGIGSTIVTGMALGAGSEVGHRAVGGLMNSFGGSGDSAPAPAAPPIDTAAIDARCQLPIREFYECLDNNNQDMSACQYYYQIMQNCRGAV